MWYSNHVRNETQRRRINKNQSESNQGIGSMRGDVLAWDGMFIFPGVDEMTQCSGCTRSYFPVHGVREACATYARERIRFSTRRVSAKAPIWHLLLTLSKCTFPRPFHTLPHWRSGECEINAEICSWSVVYEIYKLLRAARHPCFLRATLDAFPSSFYSF